MKINRCLPFVVVAVAFAIVAPVGISALPTGDIYNANGFENPPFVIGQLAGQDGWVAPPPLSPAAASVSTSQPYEGVQSVRVRGTDLEHQDFIHDVTNGYYDAIGSYRRPVFYDVGGNGFPIVRIAAAVRVQGPPSPGHNNFFSASIAARALVSAGGTVGVGELAVSSDGRVYGYSGDDDVPTFQASAPISLGEYHRLAVDVDFFHKTYTFVLDDNLLAGPFPFPGGVDTNVLARGSLVTYTAPDTTTRKKSNYVAYYDNFSISTR